MQEQLDGLKEQIELRLELKYRHISNSFFKKDKLHKHLIQGTPFRACIIIKNLSSKNFKGAKLKECKFTFNGHSILHTVSNDIQIPSLNAKQEVELEVINATFNVDGSCWFSCDILPESENQEVLTFQYDKEHDIDDMFPEINKWGESTYIEGKLASLQVKTNNYILILTLITVLEAVFGIKEILLSLTAFLSTTFSLVSEFFAYFNKFT